MAKKRAPKSFVFGTDILAFIDANDRLDARLSILGKLLRAAGGDSEIIDAIFLQDLGHAILRHLRQQKGLREKFLVQTKHRHP